MKRIAGLHGYHNGTHFNPAAMFRATMLILDRDGPALNFEAGTTAFGVAPGQDDLFGGSSTTSATASGFGSLFGYVDEFTFIQIQV